jgi:hypothetical protein
VAAKTEAVTVSAAEAQVVATTWSVIETVDKVNRTLREVEFYAADGEVLPSWCVPLAMYLEAYAHLQSFSPKWTEMAHRTVVARAVLHHLPVPMAVVDCHDAQLLAEMVVREQRLHGPMPNLHCRICSPAENKFEEG